MRIGSLFSGYGGLDMAVEAVTGATTAWVSDIDKGACKILAHRLPDVPNLGDITAIDWSQVEPVDILTGGFPCQDLSHAGKRAGLKEGTRSGLWSHMARAIDNLRPRLVVAENVRGLLSAPAPGDVEPCPWCVGDGPAVDLRALGVVLADLADLGYDAQWCGLRAADVGACHGRFRVFVIAYPAGDDGRSWSRGRRDESSSRTPDSPIDGHREGRPQSARLVRRPDAAQRGHADVVMLPTPPASDTNGPGAHGDGGLDLRTAVSLLPTPAVNDMGAGKSVEDWDAWTDRMKDAHGNGNGHGKSLSIEAQRLLPTPTRRDYKDSEVRREPHRPDDVDTLSRALAPETLLPTPTATDAKASGGGYNGQSNITLTDATVRNGMLLPTPSVADVEGGRKARSGDRADELLLNGIAHAERFGDYAPAIARWEHTIGRPAPDPTEPTGREGAHRLSPAFVEWMMGLPEGWVTETPGLTRNEALKALGNGVVPQQAATALRHMLASEVAA